MVGLTGNRPLSVDRSERVTWHRFYSIEWGASSKILSHSFLGKSGPTASLNHSFWKSMVPALRLVQSGKWGEGDLFFDRQYPVFSNFTQFSKQDSLWFVHFFRFDTSQLYLHWRYSPVNWYFLRKCKPAWCQRSVDVSNVVVFAVNINKIQMTHFFYHQVRCVIA